MPKVTAEDIYRVLVTSKSRRNFTIQDATNLHGRGITNMDFWSKALDIFDYIEGQEIKKKK